MRVEILEKRISDVDPKTEHHYVVHLGDVLTVPDDVGTRWCAYGWAKDADGNVETGERIPGRRAVHNPNGPTPVIAADKLDVESTQIRRGRK